MKAHGATDRGPRSVDGVPYRSVVMLPTSAGGTSGRSVEARAIGRGSESHPADHVLAEGVRAAQTALLGYLIHGQLGGLQQLSGPVDAPVQQPLERAQPSLCVEPPTEGAHAHLAVTGQVGQ